MGEIAGKLIADLTTTERMALRQIAAEMRSALTLVRGAAYLLTQAKSPKKARRFLPTLNEGVERLLRAVCAAEEIARASPEGSKSLSENSPLLAKEGSGEVQSQPTTPCGPPGQGREQGFRRGSKPGDMREGGIEV
ncbi:MAG: hypothetical protein NZT92_07240 [Abditibacteriales bacterium]|nr:hypothetical protein [Abditibacteriales bacterium]MDW8364369.1 hypothetical protein [Abditibacteriales bacterium]